MKVALLFIDGVGIGAKDPAINPLARQPFLLSQFEDGTGESLSGGEVFSVDATFGVAGRPQSASNQTALLTGEPAPVLIGRHLLGFPNAPLRELIARRSIVKRLVEAGRTATFANCYPAGYLDALNLKRTASQAADVDIPPSAVRKLRASATTLAMTAGGVLLRTLDDARRGEGLTNDIDGDRARKRGFDVPLRTPEQAARIFLELTRHFDFTLFEHYLADEAGHAMDWMGALETLGAFDRFAREVVRGADEELHVLICSDHGNVEDLSNRRHTLHQVPVLSFGPARGLGPGPRNVSDVGTAILRSLGIG